jgi:hypothetical protein
MSMARCAASTSDRRASRNSGVIIMARIDVPKPQRGEHDAVCPDPSLS